MLLKQKHALNTSNGGSHILGYVTDDNVNWISAMTCLLRLPERTLIIILHHHLHKIMVVGAQNESELSLLLVNQMVTT